MSRWHELAAARHTLADLGAPVDHDVLIVGAGLSGIGTAVRIRQRLPHLRVRLLEARWDLGGT